VHIGVDVVSSFRYGGGMAQLKRACIDMRQLARLASRRGFSVVALGNERATVSTVRQAVMSAVRELRAGDAFVLTFSGHGVGAHTAGIHQQAWCLFDDTLLRYGENGLDALLAQFRRGVRILVVANCCFAAASGARTPPTPPIRAHVVRIAASSARDLAYEHADEKQPSPFVTAFKNALRGRGDVFQFIERLGESYGSPRLEINGPRSESFLAGGPFPTP
jgi:Caspase domain